MSNAEQEAGERTGAASAGAVMLCIGASARRTESLVQVLHAIPPESGVAVVLAVEPIRTTLGYGQVNTLLMALVVADLLPDRPGERRRIPQGTLIGLAAAIKLTPMLFVVFAFLAGRRRVAVTGVVSFAVFTGIGALLLTSETLEFFFGLSGGDTRTASPLYTGNQSLLGVFFRLGDTSRTTAPIAASAAGLSPLTWGFISRAKR